MSKSYPSDNYRPLTTRRLAAQKAGVSSLVPGALPTLLIVDDDETLARGYARSLKSFYDVTVSHNGVAATTLLQEEHFDVILSDVLMPGISGVELLRIVRAYDLDVPVVLMTGAPDMGDMMAACELGAAGFLLKPIKMGELIRRLGQALALRHLTRAKREAFEIARFSRQVPMMPVITDRAGLTVRLDSALASLRLAFQPIVSARDGRVVAHEVLMRSGEPALATPAAILDAAERIGEVHAVTDRVMELVVEALPRLADDISIFVNIHADDLRTTRLMESSSPLAAHAKRIVLELTERGPIDTIPLLPTKVRDLRKLGYRLAIDDLGAGYAGLTTFASIEPDIVKIDMALIRNIDTSIVRQRVVSSIVRLCRELSMIVVAEGIETAEELAKVNDIGCDLLQGYLLGRPTDTFVETIRNDVLDDSGFFRK